MKFGDIIVPARTLCTILGKESYYEADAPGVQLNMIVHNWDIKRDDIENSNKIMKYRSNINEATLSGILISTNTQSVYMDASSEVYYDYGLYDFQLEKIFGKDNIPEKLFLGKYQFNGKDSRLRDVIAYLEEEFTAWVFKNCDFITITKSNIEDYEPYNSELSVGDTTLSTLGLEQFYEKQLEFKKMLEVTGFTYNFKGGLTWDD